jgi:hypothetical protein
MAKKSSANSVTPRGELVKYARELGLDKQLEHAELMRVVDAALEVDKPREFLEAVARERAGETAKTPTVEAALKQAAMHADFKGAEAAAERVAEVLDGALTDTAIGKLEIPLATFEKSPPCETFAVQTVADPQFYLHLPNLAGVKCPGYLNRKVEAQLTPLARKTLTSLRQHLDRTNARLLNGKHVDSVARTVNWLLEQYGRAAGLQE